MPTVCQIHADMRRERREDGDVHTYRRLKARGVCVHVCVSLCTCNPRCGLIIRFCFFPAKTQLDLQWACHLFFCLTAGAAGGVRLPLYSSSGRTAPTMRYSSRKSHCRKSIIRKRRLVCHCQVFRRSRNVLPPFRRPPAKLHHTGTPYPNPHHHAHARGSYSSLGLISGARALVDSPGKLDRLPPFSVLLW